MLKRYIASQCLIKLIACKPKRRICMHVNQKYVYVWLRRSMGDFLLESSCMVIIACMSLYKRALKALRQVNPDK